MADLTDPKVLGDIFSYHTPDPDQIPKYTELRAAAHDFAKVIIATTPKCADQSAAIRLVGVVREEEDRTHRPPPQEA